MILETASWNDILPILRTNFRIWSPGLSQSDYRHYIWSQLHSPWSRRNLRYIILRVAGETRASCKTYEISVRSRSQTFSFAVLGAIFTPEKFRGQGFATDLIEGLIDRFQEQSLDGILLYSDIDPEFYESLGFDKMGSSEFLINLPEDKQKSETSRQSEYINGLCREYKSLVPNKSNDNGANSSGTCHLDPGLESQMIAEMTRCHSRWLRRQPFGIERTEDYFDYKLGRERFIAAHSKLGWPDITLTTVNFANSDFGYALTECSGITMRVLEVIGSENANKLLWRHLYDRAVASGIKRMRGWESIISEFAPTFSFREILPESSKVKGAQCKIRSLEREWGMPMFFALNDRLRSWFKTFPCPLLELDL
jgi:GNAT superfamily N-acetyltransferase